MFTLALLAIAFIAGLVIGAENPSVLARAKADLLFAQAQAQRLNNIVHPANSTPKPKA
jgi:hypothetical protein